MATSLALDPELLGLTFLLSGEGATSNSAYANRMMADGRAVSSERNGRAYARGR
jgi:hypothetical protein